MPSPLKNSATYLPTLIWPSQSRTASSFVILETVAGVQQKIYHSHKQLFSRILTHRFPIKLSHYARSITCNSVS